MSVLKHYRRSKLAACLLGMLVGALTRHAPAQDAAPAATSASERVVVARFGDQEVYKDEVDRGVELALRSGQASADVLPTLQAEILEAIVKRKLIRFYLDRERLLPTHADVDQQLQVLTANLQRESMTMEQFLASAGRTLDELREDTEYRLGLQILIDKRATDAVLEKYFDEHRQEFDGSVLRFSHIIWRVDGVDRVRALNEVVAKAEQVRQAIAGGKLTFEEAAARYSAGPSRRKGGDVGFMPRRGRMEPRFGDAAFKLKKDEISPPVRTGVGVHLIKCTDVRPGQKSWVEVRDELIEAYRNVLLNEILAEELKQSKLTYTGAMPYFVFGTQQLVAPPRQPAK